METAKIVLQTVFIAQTAQTANFVKTDIICQSHQKGKQLVVPATHNVRTVLVVLQTAHFVAAIVI